MPAGKKRWWVLAAACLIVVAAIGVLLSRGNDGLPPSQTLPDGTVVSIAKVSFGKIHRFLPGNSWQRFAARILPDKLAQRLRIPNAPFVVTNAADTTVIFLKFARPAATNAGASFSGAASLFALTSSLHLMDDAGNDYNISSSVELESGFSYPSDFVIQAFKLPLVSHVATKLDLQFSHSYPAPGVRTAYSSSHFSIPNPAPRSSSRWKAEALPLTNQVDDLSFELLELGTRPPRIPPPSTNRNRPPPDLENFTTIHYRILQNGVFALGQRIKSLTLFDEDGNDYNVPVQFGGSPERIEFRGGFSPQQVFKYRFELGRVPPFDSDESVTLTNVTVPDAPPGNTLSNQSLSLELHGYTMHIDQLSELDNFRQVHLRYRITPPPEGLRHYIIIKSTDDSDQEINIVQYDGGTGAGGGAGFGRSPASPRPATNRVDIVFALTKSRFVEFLAQPKAVQTNTAAGR